MKDLNILFENEAILVVSKPSGLAVHGGAGEGNRTVIQLLRGQNRSEKTASSLHPVHRLDKGTSGVLVLAKSKEAASDVSKRWSLAKKRYLALALGEISTPRSIDVPLRGDDGRWLDALTHIEPLAILTAVSPSTTLLKVEIETGRTHQIRRHLAGIQHPVLLDKQYGDFSANRTWARSLAATGLPKPKELMLHCLSVGIPNPLRPREKLSFIAPVPGLWANILEASGGMVDLLHQVS